MTYGIWPSPTPSLINQIRIGKRYEFDTPVHDDPTRQLTVDLVVPPENLGEVGQQVVVELLGGIGVHVCDAHPLGQCLVHAGDHSSDTSSLLGCVVVGVVANDHGVLNTRYSYEEQQIELTYLEWHFDSPGLSSQLAVHLQGDLGGHRHHALGLAEERI